MLNVQFDFQLIDSMSYSKQNVFHWHLTDSQSFPLLMPSLPDFVRYGAYRPDQAYMPDQVHLANMGHLVSPKVWDPNYVGQVLSLKVESIINSPTLPKVKELVEYARERGVQVKQKSVDTNEKRFQVAGESSDYSRWCLSLTRQPMWGLDGRQ